MVRIPYDVEQRDEPRMGLIVLQADETIENDLRRLVPAAASLHVSRVPSGHEVTPETLSEMRNHIGQSARLLPDSARFDVVGYGCTSGTSVIGVKTIADLVHGGATTLAVTEPVSALIAACKHLGVSRLAFLSPYVAEVSSRMRTVLADNGIETPVFGSFETAEESIVARITGASAARAAVDLAVDPAVEAVFVSCTNLRTLDIIADVEEQTGKPVLSSNQVLAWQMCRLSGLATTTNGVGKLFSA
ncbi:Asp/Glu racemase [uncultured Roseibium sp.]|uniref:maleate cis-trans isomerase family protein n=1 Tax=uncultured Roseibium sp. TaxID=1936171 RepID=UPI0032170136